ncbi:hypothetical protein Golob_015788 [Gossypium lobatum]|uniref:Cytochrome P450 n=1 Tax=Gossypium lobatum TaxID=34289 RepID=A0A7J8M250_9ROSI|nr:hypothetical protein [Gossypium lobatum]
MVEAGKPNLADYFPLLKKIDPKGVRCWMTVYFNKLLNLFGNMFDERRQSRQSQDYSVLLKAKKELDEAIDKENPVEESDINHVKGKDFGLIPFGAGRRICPRLLLANRMLHLILGYLINYFDWELEGEISPNEMNMKEKYGIVVQMVESLLAILILV